MTAAVAAPTPQDLHRWRRQMCGSAASWAHRPGMVGTVNDGHCSLLTGLPTPDFNVVLVDSGDPAACEAALADIETMGVPALLALAAEGTRHASDLPEGWTVVGEMPIMAIELTPGAEKDPRVRRATAADVAAVGRTWADAYGFDPAVADAAADLILSAGPSSRAWLLEDDGDVVSAVVSTHADDSVSIWAMATPPDRGRRGFGRALLGTVLSSAADDGTRLALLGATEAGYPLYESTGWRTVEHWTVAVTGHSEQFS